MDFTSIILAVISAAGGGGVLGAVLTFALNRQKQRHTADMELLPHMVARINSLEAAHQKCSDDRAVDQLTIGRLQEAIARLDKENAVKAEVAAAEKVLQERIAATEKGILDKITSLELYLHTRIHDMRGESGVFSNTANSLRMAVEKLVAAMPKPPEPATPKEPVS